MKLNINVTDFNQKKQTLTVVGVIDLDRPLNLGDLEEIKRIVRSLVVNLGDFAKPLTPTNDVRLFAPTVDGDLNPFVSFKITFEVNKPVSDLFQAFGVMASFNPDMFSDPT